MFVCVCVCVTSFFFLWSSTGQEEYDVTVHSTGTLCVCVQLLSFIVDKEWVGKEQSGSKLADCVCGQSHGL